MDYKVTPQCVKLTFVSDWMIRATSENEVKIDAELDNMTEHEVKTDAELDNMN